MISCKGMMTMIQKPIIEINVHGLTVEQAISKIEEQIARYEHFEE